MKKLLILLNAIIFVSTYSINYKYYDVTGPYREIGTLAGDTYGTNLNGYSFNLPTSNDFEIRFAQAATANYTNPLFHSFRNLKFTGNDKNNMNLVKIKGYKGFSDLYTQRIDLENVKLQPDQVNLIMSGDDGNSYLNMKNSEVNLTFGNLSLKQNDTFHLNSLEGLNVISGWQYSNANNNYINIDINPNSELSFSYVGVVMKGRTDINVNKGKLSILGDSTEFAMKSTDSRINLNSSELLVKNSSVNVELQNLTSDQSKITVDGSGAKLSLFGLTNLNDSIISLERGEINILNGISNGTTVIENTKGGTFKTTSLTVDGGHLLYYGSQDSSKNNFKYLKVNNGLAEFSKESHLSGNFTVDGGHIKFNNNILFGELNGRGGTISGSVDVMGGTVLGVNLNNTTYQTFLNINDIEDPSNNRYKADRLYSDAYIKGLDTIVVKGNSVNAKDYENKKFTVANAPTITGNKNIVHDPTLPALVEFDVIDDSSVSDQDVTLVGKIKSTSSLATHSSITNNNSGSSQPNAQQVVNILPPSTTGGNQPPLTSGAQKLQNALLTMTNAQVNQNLNSLHAEPYSSHLTIGLEQNDLFLNMVMDHSRPQGNAYTGDTEKINLQNNMWIDTAYVEGKVNGEDNLGDFKYSLTNFILGGDLYQKDQLILGAYTGYGKHKMREHDMVTQDFETDTYHLGGYGSYIYKDFIFTGMFGYSYGNNQSERDVTIGIESGTSKDKFDSHSIYTGVRGAYPIGIAKNTTLTPNLGLSYSYLYQEEVVESGFDMADLRVDSARADSFITSAGLNLSYDGAIKSVPVRPIAFVRYEHDWSAAKDSTHDIRAGFVHTPDSMTTFSGQNRGKNLVLVGIGVEVEVTPVFLVGGGISYSDDSNGEETGVGFNFEYLW